MAKFIQVVLIVALVFVACNAEAPRYRFTKRTRFSGQRQVAAEEQPAVTPYPSADELKPEIPFDDEQRSEIAGEPDLTYGPPDQVYGPPELEADAEAAAVGPQADEPAPAAAADEESQVGRLVTGNRRKAQALRRVARPAKLQAPAARLVRVARQQPSYIAAQPILLADGPFAYSAQYQSW